MDNFLWRAENWQEAVWFRRQAIAWLGSDLHATFGRRASSPLLSAQAAQQGSLWKFSGEQVLSLVCSPPSPLIIPCSLLPSISWRTKSAGCVIGLKKCHLLTFWGWCCYGSESQSWSLGNIMLWGHPMDLRPPLSLVFTLPSPVLFLLHVLHPLQIHLQVPHMPFNLSSLSLYISHIFGEERIWLPIHIVAKYTSLFSFWYWCALS